MFEGTIRGSGMVKGALACSPGKMGALTRRNGCALVATALLASMLAQQAGVVLLPLKVLILTTPGARAEPSAGQGASGPRWQIRRARDGFFALARKEAAPPTAQLVART